MKKLAKIFIVLTMLSFIFISPVKTLAYDDDIGIANDFHIGAYNVDEDAIENKVKPLYTALYIASIIISIVSLTILGLMYIGGGVQEKADYKKNLVPVLVGIMFISFLLTIIGTLAKIAKMF